MKNINNELISVIVPVYNRGYCLRKCLDSIKEQSYTYWECIVIDDGSSDDSLSVAYEYQRDDSRFRIISQENRGVSAARNRGLEVADGVFVTFVDSDDYVVIDYLWMLYEAIGETDLSIGGIYNNRKEPLYYQNKTIYLKMEYEADFAGLELKNLLNGPVAKLFRMDMIRREHISFIVNRSYGEDVIFNFAYLKQIQCLRVISDCLYYIEPTPNSLSQKPIWHINEDFVLLWQVRNSFYGSKGMIGPALYHWLCLLYSVMYSCELIRIYASCSNNSFIQRYKSIKEGVERMDKEKIKNAEGFPKWKIFLFKYPAGIWILLECKYLLFKITGK